MNEEIKEKLPYEIWLVALGFEMAQLNINPKDCGPTFSFDTLYNTGASAGQAAFMIKVYQLRTD